MFVLRVIVTYRTGTSSSVDPTPTLSVPANDCSRSPHLTPDGYAFLC